MEWGFQRGYRFVYYRKKEDCDLEVGKTYTCSKSRVDGWYIVFDQCFTPPAFRFSTEEELFNHFMERHDYIKRKIEKIKVHIS